MLFRSCAKVDAKSLSVGGIKVQPSVSVTLEKLLSTTTESVLEMSYAPLLEVVNGTVGTPISSPRVIELEATTAKRKTLMGAIIN